MSSFVIAINPFELGASDRRGWFHEPPILTEVEQEDGINQNEVFGPVVTIQHASTDEEMLAIGNDVPFGLAASLLTSDIDPSLRFPRELAFGTTWVNQDLALANEMPFGGFGQSGYGKEPSAHAVDEYSQVRHFMMKAVNS